MKITMEEEMMSMIPYATTNTNEEYLDSKCSNNEPDGNKRSRIERFKGVVPQQNGHWGAQIYTNYQRIWLGTFRSEIDAAMAYDSAAIKLRKGDLNRNFQLNNFTIQETDFQSHFSSEAVLNMISDGSYPSRFAEFLRSQQVQAQMGLDISSIHGDGDYSCTLLFQKDLTPSDVGKLNRLVIPKRYAVKHFPDVPVSDELNLDGQRMDDVQIQFYDREMNLWKFRYCYWKSSQSFVFTRGWNRFVKEKGLRANDTVSFYSYESRKGRHFEQSFLVIDVAGKDEPRNDGGPKLKLERDADSEGVKDHTKGFKLFGVQID